MPYFSADCVYTPGATPGSAVLHVENGLIVAVLSVDELTPEQREGCVHFKDAAFVPGFVNTHTHSFQSLLKGVCDDADFFTWRDQALYKHSKTLTEHDIYVGALFAFAEMIKTGSTTVCDFFYLNDQANQNAAAVIQAAEDLGMRITLARCLYNWEGAPQRYQESLDQAVQNTVNLFQTYALDPMVHVIPAPHSLHGASIDMIRLGAQLAEDLDTVMHMHVAEGQYEREMIQERHGEPPIRFLHTLGLLNHRFVGIHCVWVDEDEIHLMAQQRAGVSYNPSSNMFLGDGLTPIEELRQAGVVISLGTDGGCSNNRGSMIDEMRETGLLQKVRLLDGTMLPAEESFAMATANGGKNLNLPIGKLQAGYTADFTVVHLNDLSMQPRQFVSKNLVYSMQPSAIQAVYVAGKPVYQDGQLVNIPEEKIVALVQQVTKTW